MTAPWTILWIWQGWRQRRDLLGSAPTNLTREQLAAALKTSVGGPVPTDPAVRAEAARMARSHYAAYEGESLWPVLVIFGLFAAGTAWQPWCRRMVLGRGRSHRAGGGAIGLDAEAAGGAPERPPRAMRTMHYVAGDATSTMLHGDLHFGNILRSRREPWLAIDPKGWSGPLAWDTFTVIAGRREDLQQHDDISRDISDRIQRFSAAAGINPDLAAACCQARAVSSYLYQHIMAGAWFDLEFLRVLAQGVQDESFDFADPALSRTLVDCNCVGRPTAGRGSGAARGKVDH